MSENMGRKIANDARLLKRSCESLLGLCMGMMADGRLDDDEIKFLNLWLLDNDELRSCWPGEVVYARVKDVLADNVITDDERKYLESTLSQLIGGTMQETGTAFGGSTSLPLDQVGEVTVDGRKFCFTGKFLYGTRKACVKAIEARGGTFVPRVRTDLDYLVIGTLSSREWANTSHGRKIEQAMKYKGKGIEISILSEEDWAKCLE
jgi:NAD-dependent DNA ligase